MRFVLPCETPLSSGCAATALRRVDARDSTSASSDISAAGVLGTSCLILRCVADPGSVTDSSPRDVIERPRLRVDEAATGDGIALPPLLFRRTGLVLF